MSLNVSNSPGAVRANIDVGIAKLNSDQSVILAVNTNYTAITN
jgi:hypothetical protein